MFTVYWTFTDDEGNATAMMQPEEKLTDALAYCEFLRASRRDGRPITAITMVSENPDSVGQAGVDVTGPDYEWKKRR